jgi:NADH dehydrogenase FAD-containing subunit
MTTNIDLIKDPECLDGRFIKVKATMEIDHPSSDYNNVFVIGDASNHPTPKLAYWGMMQGAHLAESLSAKIRHGQDIKPYVEPPTEAMFLPLGPTGGVSQLPVCGGIVVGDFMTRMLKSKDLLSGMFWDQLNAKMP